MTVRPLLLLLVASGLVPGASLVRVLPDPQIAFEENRGQVRSEIRYLVRPNAYITANSIVFGPKQVPIQFAEANPNPSVRPFDTLPGVANVLSGADWRHWQIGVSRYARVEFGAMYPGIDVTYLPEGGRLTCRIAVNPGADLARVRLEVTGAASLRLSGEALTIVWRSYGFREDSYQLRAPSAFQETPAGRVPVSARFKLGDGVRFGLEAGSYDETRPLSIDLSMVGLSDIDASAVTLTDAVMSPSGSVYVTGSATALVVDPVPKPYPLEPAARVCAAMTDEFVEYLYPCTDAFVAKYAPSGGLVFISYLSGSANAKGTRVRLDRDDNVYVAGATDSPDFPIVSGAPQTAYAGPSARLGLTPASDVSGDIFVAKLDGGRGVLFYSTYLGGPDYDYPADLAVDAAGNAYITGRGAPGLPVTPGAFRATPDPECAGCTAGFAAKLDSRGSRLLYLTYLAGLSQATAVDSQGSLYFAGAAKGELPITPGALQTTKGGGWDAYIAKLTPAGDGLVYATYYGGSGSEIANHIAVDSQGNAWVTGSTDSFSRGFLIKLSAGGSRLLYSGRSVPGELFLDRDENLIVATGYSFPGLLTTPDAMLTLPCGGYVAKLSPDGSSLLFASYVTGLLGVTGLDPKGNPLLLPQSEVLYKLNLLLPPEKSVGCVVGAASLSTYPISLGEIVAIAGAGLGPQQGVSAQPDAEGRIGTSLGGTRVLVAGVPAPVLYAQYHQVNVAVPFALSTPGAVEVEVEYLGEKLPPLLVGTNPVGFNIFTTDGSGTGQAAAMNEDGTLNSPSNPARLGSVITLWGTGAGQTDPPSLDGEIAAGARNSQAQLGAWLGYTTPCLVEYAGAAPTLIVGVTQVNIRLPDSVENTYGYPLGAMPIKVTVNGQFLEPQVVTIAVRQGPAPAPALA